MEITVVGLGRLGLPLAAVLGTSGYDVHGVDINREIVDSVNAGVSPIPEPGLQDLLTKANIRASSDFSSVIDSSVSFVIVPTPSQSDGSFTNEYVLEAISQIGIALQHSKKPHTVVLCSTVMPGSTNGSIRLALERSSKRKIGDRLRLCFSPEFIALGSVIHDMQHPDMILLGADSEDTAELIEPLLLSITKNKPPVARMNIVNAEIAKISLNSYVTMKISFANTLAEVCEKIEGADAHVVTDAIGMDSRIGKKYLKPATPAGGPCFPRDQRAFVEMGKRIEAQTLLAYATDRVNKRQVSRLAEYVVEGPVGILGLAYKPDTYVTEESVGIALANKLSRYHTVYAYDPMVSSVASDKFVLTQSAEELVKLSATVIIATPWPKFSQLVYKDVKRVLDCWGQAGEGPNILRVGTYMGDV